MTQPAFGENGRHVAQKSPAESVTSKQSRMLWIPFYIYSIRTVGRKNSKKMKKNTLPFIFGREKIPALSQQKSLDLHFRSSPAQIHWVVRDRKNTFRTTFQLSCFIFKPVLYLHRPAHPFCYSRFKYAVIAVPKTTTVEEDTAGCWRDNSVSLASLRLNRRTVRTGFGLFGNRQACCLPLEYGLS